MRRRITFAILGTVAAALVLAGLGTLALNRVGARSSARSEIDAQAAATAAILDIRATPQKDANGNRITVKERLALIRESLSLEDVSLIVYDKSNALRTDLGDPLPGNVTLTSDQVAELRGGQTVSGGRANTVYAGVPLPKTTNDFQPVLLFTRNVGPSIGTGVRWFVLASIITILLGAVIAARLSRRLTKPLVEATDATARIARGDLSVRLPARHGASPDELDALASSINEMADSLQRSRGLEQQFLLSVSHDLRTPLTSIQGYAEAIADGAVPDEQAAAGIILTESRRLERLVRDLLDLAKLESRQFSFGLRTVDLGELVGDSADGFRRQVEEADLQLRFEPPAQVVPAIADPDRLAQVVANLVENALKYAAGSITLAVVADPSAPRIEVADDGPGIAAQDLPHVFERLYVASHEPVRKEIGSGLGLAIVRELVEAMGGSVRAEADPGGGARMVVTLRPALGADLGPVVPPPAPARGGPPAGPAPPPYVPPPGPPPAPPMAPPMAPPVASPPGPPPPGPPPASSGTAQPF
jgi:two-component system sensor histidine kinase BaeS